MKKVKILSTALILLIGMFFMVQSCQKEDLNVASDFEKQFSLNEFKDEFVKTNLMVDWYDSKKIESTDESTQYLFNTTLKTRSAIHSSTGSLDFKYQILAQVDKNGKISFEVLKFLANDEKSVEKISYDNTDFFSGTLYQYNLKGELSNMTAFKNGIELEKIASDKITLMNQSKYVPKEDAWVLVITEHWTDWYKLVGGGWVYTHSTLDSVSYEWVYVSSNYSYSNYHHHSDTPTGGHPTRPIDVHPDEILIDNSFKNIDKINCTYNQLLKTSSIQQILKDFFGADAKFDLTFNVVENLNCGNNTTKDSGCTTLNSDGSISISIDKGYINDTQTPTLFIAKTILHEAIHANLYSAVIKLNNGTLPPDSDFDTLYELYRQKKGWQHEFMADRYIDMIAKGLQDVHSYLGDQTFINDRNQNYSNWDWSKFYEEIAWMGLYDTTKGQEHINAPDYTVNSNLYILDTKTDSTKQPKCN